MNFGDLKDDVALKEKINNLHESINKIETTLEVAYTSINEEELSLKDRLNYDLYIAYTLNTLYWLYLRSKGIDPNEDEVKNQINRVREYMVKAKAAIERHTKRTRIDVPVAQRFIKHGIKHSKVAETSEETQREDNKRTHSGNDDSSVPKKKKIM